MVSLPLEQSLMNEQIFLVANLEGNSVGVSILIIILAILDFTFQIARPYIGQYNSETNSENGSLSFAEVSMLTIADRRGIIRFWLVS